MGACGSWPRLCHRVAQMTEQTLERKIAELSAAEAAYNRAKLAEAQAWAALGRCLPGSPLWQERSAQHGDMVEGRKAAWAEYSRLALALERYLGRRIKAAKREVTK